MSSEFVTPLSTDKDAEAEKADAAEHSPPAGEPEGAQHQAAVRTTPNRHRIREMARRRGVPQQGTTSLGVDERKRGPRSNGTGLCQIRDEGRNGDPGASDRTGSGETAGVMGGGETRRDAGQGKRTTTAL